MPPRDVAFASAGTRLAGELSVPDGAEQVPGLVLVGGSGPSDRHNGGFFDVIAEHLVGEGVAVLRYDKRGAGQSEGEWAHATPEQLAGDAAAAVRTLSTELGVARGHIGVFGHSEGGWVALRLCAGKEAPGHVILNSCPAVSFIDSEVFALRAAGASREQAQAAGALLARLSAAARAGRSLEHGARMLAAARTAGALDGGGGEAFELTADSWAQLEVWGDYDPSADLARLAIPALAVLGGEDPLVPVADSVAAYERSAVEQLLVLPGAEHRLRTLDGDGLAPGYLEALSARCRELRSL